MQINIRPANENDFSAIYALIHEFASFQKTPEKVLITPEQMLQNKDLFQCLVAVTDEQQIIGFASYFYAYYSWSGKAIYLDDLYVIETYRKQKAGSQLLNALIQLAKQQQCVKLRWQVSSWNKSAIGFYKSIGAYIDDTEINCDLNLQV